MSTVRAAVLFLSRIQAHQLPLVSVSHVSPCVEERLQDGGVSACGLWGLVWVGFGVFVPFSTI